MEHTDDTFPVIIKNNRLTIWSLFDDAQRDDLQTKQAHPNAYVQCHIMYNQVIVWDNFNVNTVM